MLMTDHYNDFFECSETSQRFSFYNFQNEEIRIPTMFLGMNLIPDPEQKLIMLNQQTYINKSISEYTAHMAKITAVTPMQRRVNFERATN